MTVNGHRKGRRRKIWIQFAGAQVSHLSWRQASRPKTIEFPDNGIINIIARSLLHLPPPLQLSYPAHPSLAYPKQHSNSKRQRLYTRDGAQKPFRPSSTLSFPFPPTTTSSSYTSELLSAPYATLTLRISSPTSSHVSLQAGIGNALHKPT